MEQGVSNYRVLITDVPPAPSTDGHEAQVALMDLNVPVFSRDIRRASAFNKAVQQEDSAGKPETLKGKLLLKLLHPSKYRPENLKT